MFEIDDTPYPMKREVRSKYTETFNKLRVGQCIKCDPELVPSVSRAMQTWLRRSKVIKGRPATDLRVSIVSRSPDGYGRVYLLPTKPLLMQDVPARKVHLLGD